MKKRRTGRCGVKAVITGSERAHRKDSSRFRRMGLLGKWRKQYISEGHNIELFWNDEKLLEKDKFSAETDNRRSQSSFCFSLPGFFPVLKKYSVTQCSSCFTHLRWRRERGEMLFVCSSMFQRLYMYSIFHIYKYNFWWFMRTSHTCDIDERKTFLWITKKTFFLKSHHTIFPFPEWKERWTNNKPNWEK